MKFLIDTNVITEVRKNQTSAVTGWFNNQYISDIAISVITLMELEIGVQRVERKDTRQGAMLRVWLENHVKILFANQILPMDEDVALANASLHVPNQMSYLDSQIAATAIHHDLTLVTRNVKDVETSGLKIFNPWDD